MRRIRNLWMLIVLLIATNSCIEEFDPVIIADDAKKFVVVGSIQTNRTTQIINISLTSPVETPNYIPVSGCWVNVSNNQGETFQFTDIGNGDYAGEISAASLTPGISWKVEIRTPENEIISSSFDQMTSGPQIDSVYYRREDIESALAGDFTKGIRFYTDFNGTESDSKYYRWELTETFEHHADYPIIWWYDGVHVNKEWPPDSSRMFCWTTQIVPEIFTLSTTNLTQNKFSELPLHFVNNYTARLVIGYSLLVSQYSLSEEAFIYWDQMRINSQQQGGLYDKQPLAIKGNLVNETNPEKEVLGYFFASSVNEKRIFVSNVPGLPIEYTTRCNPQFLRKGLREFQRGDYPAYLLGDEFGWSPFWLDDGCVDCKEQGGSYIKPDFWPY